MAINGHDKGSLENGPNAWKKGNRTNSRRDPSKMEDISKKYSEEIKGYKEYASGRARRIKFPQEMTGEVYRRIRDYVRAKSESELPLTVSGLILALGCSSDTYYRLQAGDMDYLLYQYIDRMEIDLDTIDASIDTMPYVAEPDADLETMRGVVLLTPYSTLIQKAHLLIAEQTEERLYLKGRVGDIFALKAQHGWQEEEQQARTVNQTLIIADEQQARKAIEMLK